MDVETLERIIAGGENERVEFKRTLVTRGEDNVVKEMAAFANTEGGWILFGVDDRGQVTGIDDPKGFEERVMNLAANNLTPPLIPTFQTFCVEGKTVAVLDIPKGPNKPYRPFYVRRGTTKTEASLEELRRLYQESQLVRFDETVLERASLEDINRRKFEEYLLITTGKKIADFPIAPEELLANRGIVVRRVEGYRPTIGGVLMFGQNPQAYLPQSEISCARFKGVDIGSEFIDRKDFRGTVDEMVEGGIAFVERHSSVNATIGNVKREEVPEYQPQAVREFITNAAVHRDYSIAGAKIRILMFDDRVEVCSPGGLPNTVTLENIFTGVHYSRNRLVFEFMHALGYGERMGTGIPRTLKLCREEGYPEPRFTASESEVRVVLPSKFHGSALSEE